MKLRTVGCRRARATAVLFTVLAFGAPRAARGQVAFDHMLADGRDIRMTVIAPGIYQC
jgi:hypothetical protein